MTRISKRFVMHALIEQPVRVGLAANPAKQTPPAEEGTNRLYRLYVL